MKDKKMKTKFNKRQKTREWTPESRPMNPNTSLYSVLFIRKMRNLKKYETHKADKKRESADPQTAPSTQSLLVQFPLESK